MTEAPIDVYALLGLERRYHIDLADLRRRYLQMSRSVHPDFFGQATPAEQAVAEVRASQLNQAFARLSDPQLRLEHLMQLAGLIDHAGQTDQRLAPDFMMEVMELGERTDDPSARSSLRTEVDERLARMHDEVAALMTAYDAAEGPDRDAPLRKALVMLLQQRALRRVREQAEES